MKHRYLLIIVALIGILLLNAHTLCAQQPVPSVQWERFYGGTEDDIAYSIQQTFDGGYIVAGTTQSWNGDVAGLHGNTTYDAPDYWVLKLNATGKIQWKQCYGGGNYDYAYSIQQTMDSGYIVGGSTSSSDGDVGGNYGFGYDYWIVKLNQTGSIQWQTPLGGNDG
ncbi:MAG TPA: hypothetical protein VFJ29_07910, partial [Candidatus Kapabacteria bacterium]|nr:hypothetical protein [Candidatus Kapabacteria bacterium]